MALSLEIKSAAETGTQASTLRQAARAVLARFQTRFGSDRARAENHARHMELYHADDSTLKDMGLTRMDVIRLLETKGSMVSAEPGRFENRSSRPQPNGSDRQWDRLPLANLGRGLLPF